MGYIIILSTNYYNTMDKLKMKFSGSKYGEPLEFDIDSENDYVSLSGIFQVGSNLENSNLEGGAKSIYDYIIDPKTNKPRLSKKQLRNTARQMLHSDAMNKLL